MPIYAFIDSQNLNLGIRDQGWRLDFTRFRIYLKDKYKVEKTFLFIGYVSGNDHLYKYLQMAGYILITKPTLAYTAGKKKMIKGNVDAELVLHAMIEYNSYDSAVIVTGDGDFYCLVEYLQRQSKLAKLIIPNKNKFSALLRNFHEKTLFMTDIKIKVQKKEGTF